VLAPRRSQGSGSGQTLAAATLIHFRPSPPLSDDATGKDRAVDDGGGISSYHVACVHGGLLFSRGGSSLPVRRGGHGRQGMAEGYGSRDGGPGILAEGRQSSGLGILRFYGYGGHEGGTATDPRCSRLWPSAT
jgi:hypothetical protein